MFADARRPPHRARRHAVGVGHIGEYASGARKLSQYPEKPYIPWISPNRVWSAFQANPALFSQTVAQLGTTESNNILNSKYIEEVALIFKERAAQAERTHDGYYPSLDLNFNATERLLARAACAKTYGRPNFSNIIPNTTVNQDDDLNQDPEHTLGRISVTTLVSSPGAPTATTFRWSTIPIRVAC